MGTYRQPASLVDTQSGKLSRQATKEGFDAIGLIAKASIAQAEERKKKEKETEDAKKVILEAGAKRRAEGDATLNKNNVDDASLGKGVEAPVKAIQNAKIENLSLSTSDPRYHENLKKIAQADMFLNNLKDLMTSAVFTEKEVQEALGKGIGTGGNQVAPSSVTGEWVEFNSQTRSVSTGWEASFDISPDDSGEWGMYIIGKKGDSTLKRAVNMLSEDDETGTKYNKGTYRITPDASAEVKVVLKEDGTLTSNGGISDRYATKTQETIGSEVYDITRIDRDQLFNQTSTVANVIGEGIISNGANSIVDYVNSKGVKDPNNPKSNALGYISLKVDQNNNFVQENGEVVKGDWVQVTDDNGQFVQDLSFKEDTGYLSDEQYDAFMQFVQINTAADLGVFAPEKRILDGAATERLRKSRADAAKGAKLTDKQEIQNFNLIEINKYKERQLDELPWGQKFKTDEVNANKANTLLAETLNGLSYVGDLAGTLEVKYVEKPTGIGGKGPLDGFIEVYRISNTRRTKEDEFKLSDGGQMESFDQYLNKNLYGKVGSTNKTNAY